jgi:cell surface protein SprA
LSLRFRNIFFLFILVALVGAVLGSGLGSLVIEPIVPEDLFGIRAMPLDSPEVELPYPITDQINPSMGGSGGIDLNPPSNIESIVEYDPISGNYFIYQRIGDDIDYRNPTVMSFEEFLNYDMDQALLDYWKEKEATEAMAQSGEEGSGGGGFAPRLKVESEVFDRIFGGNTIDIRPQGTAELIFGINVNKNENPQIPERQRSITTFDFDQRIQLNIVGNIGDKMKLTTNYNTEATFDFENQMKLEYTGYEDEIIKKIEAGNVSMPLGGSLITGSQSLFGVKTDLQFGKLYATALFSQQRGQRKEINVQGGAQQQEFVISADNYEANRHFFLSSFFRSRYDQALRSLPVVNSDVRISRIEVWVVNYRANVEDNRNILAFTDIGEDFAAMTEHGQTTFTVLPGSIPNNSRNTLYDDLNIPQVRNFNSAPAYLGSVGMQEAFNYERIANARKLTQSEFTYNEKLGFISLNQALNNDERLAVSYEFFLDGQRYQVGDLSYDGITGTDALFAKLLKASLTNVRLPLWDLMMKNVYSMGAYQVNPQDFILNVWYNDPVEGIDLPFIPQTGVDQIPLIQLMGLDRLDANGASFSDGRFDFIDLAATQGGTITSQNGRIFLTSAEPFGSYLDQQLAQAGVSQVLREQIVFQPLYDSTKTAAQMIPSLNRFKLKGTYQSAASDEISLNAMNIPQGSVQVTAGGVQLRENVDYTVDYNLGRVKIINSGLLESQTPIKISLESNTLFSIQTKTLLGTRLEYRFSENFNIGGTLMHLYERPLTQKVNIGDEPVRNTIYGFDGNYSTESTMLTKIIDAIPLINTKESSSINVSGEFAHLLPGHSRAIGKEGNSYIDDFEGSQSRIDLRNFVSWQLSSVPQFNSKFPEASFVDSLVTGYNRAHLSWHIIDPLFFRNDPTTPDNINPNQHYQRQVLEREVFPNRQLPAGAPTNIPTLDLAFYPSERGQYNFDVPGGSNFSAGLGTNGELLDPETRWGGVMRSLTTTDFEQANIEFIQFWVMDPFNEDAQNDLGTVQGGKLYFHLGNVSEDILRDGLMSFENGLPPDGTDNGAGLTTTYTNWGRVPLTQSIVNAFDNTTNSNASQDVGLDGLPDTRAGFPDETSHFAGYLNQLGPLSPEALAIIQGDPANDNYRYFRGALSDNETLDILERYKRFNGLDGNSVTTSDSPPGDNFPTQATTLPSTEDVNQDLTLDGSESYFEYQVNFEQPNHPSMQVGANFITDKLVQIVDGREIIWYQFKIPVNEYNSRVNIQDFRSIRFMRMIMKDWTNPAVLRFARLELMRGEWRRFLGSLAAGDEQLVTEEPLTTFDISAVNVEENGDRSPVNYLLPPGIQQQVDIGSANLRNLNEQSLVLRTCGLEDGDARAGFRNTQVDMRLYKNLKMFVHGEGLDQLNPLDYGDVSVFIRLGSDFTDNYYEYEIPVVPTNINQLPGSHLPDDVWPIANYMDIELDKLQRLKLERDAAVRTGNPQFSNRIPFVQFDGDRRMYVKGNPVLSNVRTIMIGVRNPKKDGELANPWKTDDGLSECVEIWVNELRLTDFDNKGGWAALGRVSAKLADFGNVAVAMNYSTPGFGSLESRVQERSQETVRGLDASTNLELGKFLPDNANVKIPLYLGFSEEVSNPRFDPLAPDIEQTEVAATLEKPEASERKKRVQDYTVRRSINFTNVRKERGQNSERKPQLYDVENLSLTYGYNEIYQRTVNLEHNTTRNHRGTLIYSFAPQPKNWKPFAQVKLFRATPYFNLIKDFNVNIGPKQLGFRTDVNRTYNEMLLRNNTEVYSFPQQELYTKTFNWTRAYDFQYDITSKLRFTYTATNLALIGEPPGRVNKDFEDEYQVWKDSVMTSVQSFGTNMDFNQAFNLSYKLPFDKFPLTDWMTGDARYTGTYNWQRAALSQDTLGNTIQNSINLSYNHQLNMLTLYNKVGYLKKVNQKFKPSSGAKAGARPQTPAKPGSDVKADTKDANAKRPWDYAARVLMMVKNVNARYSQNEGTYLPGYNRQSTMFGMDPSFSAPGASFIFGLQDENFAQNAGRQGWLTDNPYVQTPYSRNYTEDFSMRVNLEPINGMRVELNASRIFSYNTSEKYRFNEDLQDYLGDSYQRMGNFSMSYLPIRTSFIKDGDNFSSPVFLDFLNNRLAVANRLAIESDFTDPLSQPDAFPDGYGATQQEVVIAAFIAAYRGDSPEDVPLDPLKYSILDALKNPNWTVNYDGLSKVKQLKKLFKTVTLNHAYRSNYSVGGFTSNPAFGNNPDGSPFRDKSDAQNFIPETQINMISITEQFAPLAGLDLTFNNSLSAKFEWKKDRNLSLSTANYQVTEIRGQEYVMGLGYIFKQVKLPVKVGGKNPKSDLTLRADLSIRDNMMLTRRMVEETNLITSGQRVISIKVAADYVISRALNIRAFYDQQLNRPRTTITFPTSNINAGISLRFTLTQ